MEKMMWGIIIVLTATGVCLATVSPTGEALVRIADRLVDTQLTEGPNAGAWQEETGYTGSITAGLAAAYLKTCNEAHKEAAILAGDFINDVSGGYYGYGDEAYAMAMLSEISDDPANNPYRTDLAAFYANVHDGEGGTEEFISFYLTGTETSTAVLYLSYHTLAAYYVDAEDKEIFRNAVQTYLSLVTDSTANWPVMALGLACWALGSTGDLDSAMVNSLLSHQFIGSPGLGEFFWRFDHTDGDPDNESPNRGFTTDTLFGGLGMAVSRGETVDVALEHRIKKTRNALLAGVNEDGSVYGHLREDSPEYAMYAGQMLTALCGVALPGDITLDDKVEGADAVALAESWLESCANACSCQIKDLNDDGKIDLLDLAELAKTWQLHTGI